ncbi:MAG TPA: YjgN family protein [Burkholderiaceae bacterium]|nr:YjgN family protein [Burkholderiaceae bacterium]
MEEIVQPPVTAPARSEAAPATPQAHRLALRFGGSGSEYFRIWVVNLLLTVVTVGLYYPFAKVRRLRYFYGNTTLGGDEFDFHGNPWKMLRGFVLMAALGGAYALASRSSPWAALVALLLMAGIWPALFRASQQFRLANTSWRGLRFQFHGTTLDAYRALIPAQIALVLYLGGVAFFNDAVHDVAGQPGERDLPPAAWVMFAGMALLTLLAPWFWWLIKRYQHGHFGLGPLRTQFLGGAGAFYGVLLKAAGIALLLIVPLAVLSGVAVAMRSPVAAGAAGVVCYLAALVLAGSFTTARLQNLVWARTRSRGLRFDSHVRVGALAKLTTKNWLLIALTLGLYLPFARVARAKLLIESVTVSTLHPPAALTAALRGMGGDAAGDASADLLGFDIGL